jgi:hypothetical protein
MRDEIRALAEIPGSNPMAGLINGAIQDTIDSITNLAKYDELFTPNHVVTIAANGVITLPSDFQHFDKDHVYFLQDNDTDHPLRLNPFNRVRSLLTGLPRQFRMYGTDSSGVITRKMEITPYGDISTADDRVMINYWRRYIWLEGVQFPIPKMEETIKLRVAARIAKQANTRLAQKLTAQARDAYAAMRAGTY